MCKEHAYAPVVSTTTTGGTPIAFTSAIAGKPRHVSIRTRLVLILVGSVCFIWQFVLVQTYARVGLYLCSTVCLSWLARKHKKPKNSLFSGYKKIAIVILVGKIIF